MSYLATLPRVNAQCIFVGVREWKRKRGKEKGGEEVCPSVECEQK